MIHIYSLFNMFKILQFHKYSTNGLFLPSSFVLKIAKLPGIGKLFPLAQSQYTFATKSSLFDPINYSLKPTTLQELRSV